MARARFVLFVVVLLILLVAFGSVTPVRAQGASAAIAALQPGNLFDGFLGPFRAEQSAISINYVILCYNVTTREKRVIETVAVIPDGSTPAQANTAMTAAIVSACAAVGFTVSANAVFLPVFQRGT